MQLNLVVTKDDLMLLAEQLTPLEVALGGRKSVSLGRPEVIELIADKGLRVRGSARLTWDGLGMTFPVSLRTWQVLLVPTIALDRNGGRSLAFEPTIEKLDLQNVPALVDGRIASAINEGMASQKKKLAWAFSRALSRKIELPARVKPAARFELEPSDAKLRVTEEAIEIAIAFETRVVRAPVPVETRSPVMPLVPAFARG